MYSTDDGKRPKRPAVPSLTSATAEVERWLRENRLDTARDGDGLDWRLQVLADQVVDPEDPRALLWRVRLKLSAEVTAAELVATGVLDRVADARLIELLGDERVPLSMKPQTYLSPHEEAARLVVAEETPKLRASLGQSSLREVKRQLVGRLVDERGRFGALGG